MDDNSLNSIHCDKCQICLKKKAYESHVCSDDLTCPVCYGPIRNAPLSYVVPKCGHIIHDIC